MKKPVSQSKQFKYKIDQSGKIEQTQFDTVLALTGLKSCVVTLKRSEVLTIKKDRDPNASGPRTA